MTIVENFTIEHNFSTSNHKLMSVNINFFQPPVVKRKVYLYSKGDYVSIQEKVNNMDWNTLLSSNNIEDNWSTFKMIYNNLVDKHIPFKCLVPGKHYKVPWLNDHIVKRAKAKRRKAKVNLNRTGLLADKLLHIQACNDYDSAVTRAKFRHETNLARHVNDNPKRFYNYAKTFTKSNCAINCLIKDDIKYVEDKHMANILNEHFVSVMTADTSNPPAFDYHANHHMSDIRFSENDIANLLIKIKPHKAIGPDGIHPHVLHEVMAFAKPLYVLFQQSITNSVLPSAWTDANICALHKKGARTDPNNYRPVSLTSHVIKTFERLILQHILGYCRKHNIISCNQHGFQAGKSCLTNLLHCMNDWTTSYDKQPKEGTDIIYTDFQKAFDSVQHKRLLHKLSVYGIQGKLLNWIKSFLTNRRQRVLLNGSPSDWEAVVSGVPQGP